MAPYSYFYLNKAYSISLNICNFQKKFPIFHFLNHYYLFNYACFHFYFQQYSYILYIYFLYFEHFIMVEVYNFVEFYFSILYQFIFLQIFKIKLCKSPKHQTQFLLNILNAQNLNQHRQYMRSLYLNMNILFNFLHFLLIYLILINLFSF